eukprot:GHVU01060681.1.p2 GENE.GHVU01060681.1~~GHVU01060681.1.p2  ORF type:complete len:199 (-),score=14.89 GHVU01060681.1:931-1527(-)
MLNGSSPTRFFFFLNLFFPYVVGMTAAAILALVGQNAHKRSIPTSRLQKRSFWSRKSDDGKDHTEDVIRQDENDSDEELDRKVEKNSSVEEEVEPPINTAVERAVWITATKKLEGAYGCSRGAIGSAMVECLGQWAFNTFTSIVSARVVVLMLVDRIDPDFADLLLQVTLGKKGILELQRFCVKKLEGMEFEPRRYVF